MAEKYSYWTLGQWGEYIERYKEGRAVNVAQKLSDFRFLFVFYPIHNYRKAIKKAKKSHKERVIDDRGNWNKVSNRGKGILFRSQGHKLYEGRVCRGGNLQRRGIRRKF